ncbi:BA75_03654T0 [Komagataella pastoris]|uniref:BA75_03654T0 n=1 Tax=Komagataella pastoris TaxID=4922 RepID=A0A1B2JF23_PICPA|nr:BA75_03654T0 [Komagataella pastoris]
MAYQISCRRALIRLKGVLNLLEITHFIQGIRLPFQIFPHNFQFRFTGLLKIQSNFLTASIPFEPTSPSSTDEHSGSKHLIQLESIKRSHDKISSFPRDFTGNLSSIPFPLGFRPGSILGSKDGS